MWATRRQLKVKGKGMDANGFGLQDMVPSQWARMAKEWGEGMFLGCLKYVDWNDENVSPKFGAMRHRDMLITTVRGNENNQISLSLSWLPKTWSIL